MNKLPRDLQTLLITPEEFHDRAGLTLPWSLPGTEGQRVRSLLLGLGGSFLTFALAQWWIGVPGVDISLGLLPLVGAIAWLLRGDLRRWQGESVSYGDLEAQDQGELDRLQLEVEAFNRIVRSLHLNDQLQQLGNPGLKPTTRRQLLQALKLIREDLVKAIATARLLRENRNLLTELALNPELFTTNLPILQRLEQANTATDLAQYLTPALTLALDVHRHLEELQRE